MAAPATPALHAMLQYRLVSLCSVRLHLRQLDRRAPAAEDDALVFFSSRFCVAPFPCFPRGCGRSFRNTTRAPLMTYVWMLRASNSRHTSRTRTTSW